MRKVKAEDLYSFKFVSAPVWSPDGDKLVFTVSKPDKAANGYLSDLWLLKDGKTVKLTSSHDVRSALWLDNDTLLFSSLRNKEDKEAAAAGKPLTVFYSLCLNGGEAAEYMRLDLKGARLKRLGNGSFACLASCDFSGEDSKAVEVFEEIPFWKNGAGYSSKIRNRLYIVNDGKAEPITKEHEEVGSFSVCGNEILFAAHDYEGFDGFGTGVFLWENGNRRTVIEDNDYLNVWWTGFCAGQPVAAMSDGKLHGMNQIPAVYSLNGLEPKELFFNDEVPGDATIGDSSYGILEKLAFDGNDLYYVTAEDTFSVIRKFDGEKLETVLTTTGAVDAIAVKDGRIVASCTGVARLPELYEVKNGALVQLTEFNEELYREREISLPERVSVMNDGWQINGYVLKPADYEEGKTYPAILDIHGGPFAAYGTAYFHEMQVWAAAGYFVFYCNPRGGAGRGSEFGDLRGKYGTIDYDDIMAFTDKVLEEYPMIDAKRVGVTGGSYGGFMTNWIIGHTDRFAAAASQRSISNWVVFYLTSDIGATFGWDQNQGDPWNDTEKLWWHSPLKYAANAKTPTLFIHADQDYRCWMADCLQMFSTLKLHGVDSRVCLFHGENHELSRGGKPENRMRRLNEITAWMDKYLK